MVTMRYLTIGLPEKIYEKVVFESGRDEVSKAIVIREALRGYFKIGNQKLTDAREEVVTHGPTEYAGENPLAGTFTGNG